MPCVCRVAGGTSLLLDGMAHRRRGTRKACRYGSTRGFSIALSVAYVIVNIGKRVGEYGLGGQSKRRERVHILLSGVQELFSIARLSAEKRWTEAYCDAPAVARQPRIGQAGRNNRDLRLPITFRLFSQLDEAGLEGKKGFQVCFRRLNAAAE